MTAEPLYFVIERGAGGRETPSIVHDILPDHLKRKGSTLLVYALRLDRLPGGAEWAQKPLDELYRVYCVLRDTGRLPPPNLADPPRKADAAQRLVGHRESIGFGTGLPPDEYPDPDAIKKNAQGGAYIA